MHLILFETTGSWGRVIEAGLFGVPSVTSTLAHREALGEGGILVPDGHDAEAVIDAYQAVYVDREHYGDLAHQHEMVDHRRSVAAFEAELRGCWTTSEPEPLRGSPAHQSWSRRRSGVSGGAPAAPIARQYMTTAARSNSRCALLRTNPA